QVPAARGFANRALERFVLRRASIVEREDAGERGIAMVAGADRIGRPGDEARESQREKARERSHRFDPARRAKPQQLRLELEQPGPSIRTLERAPRRALEVRELGLQRSRGEVRVQTLRDLLSE